MEEKELRLAKMYFKHEVNLEKFKKETFEKIDQELDREEKRKKNYPKWVLASVASLMIIGASLAFGASHMADAAQSFISQLFGSKENLMKAYPEETQGELDFFERSMQIAKENLTNEEFKQYSQLYTEQAETWKKINKENRQPDSKEAKRLHEIKELQSTYEQKFALKEAQVFASFPIIKPTYLPEGYKQVDESFAIYKEGEEPIVSLEYSDGASRISTQQLNVNQKADLEMEESGFFEQPDSYFINGFQVDYVSPSDEWPFVGMRVIVPEKGYKIILTADTMSKEEMEKVLLSMIEK
ncbi:DUF4367 domain-containing protein [Niallia sp. Sow4_A1]|uniref:DUF4367 domain-containing protein n=1 Tax=Niallia TaxID=2837506 RepID=UPI001F18A0E9|nr:MULTISPECIES: DUF4367 domain-containing protein [Niallia]MCF2648991.1 DUF4367 domain-containing protein [Niallia circulans]MCM3363716.1 DUF4367 domain-containing protein [Niallia sp. MER TA 168]